MTVVVPLRMHSIKRNLCGEGDILLAKSPVDFPPQAFEDLHEIGGRLTGDAHAARHRGIKVMVRAEEARQDDLAFTVHRSGLGVTRLQFGGVSNRHDLLPIRNDRCVPQYLIVIAKGRYNAVFKSR